MRGDDRVPVGITSWPYLCLDLCLKIICFIVAVCFSYSHWKPETEPKKKIKKPSQ